MRKYTCILVFLLLSILSFNCNQNPVESPVSQNILLYEKQGLIDSVVGTCSAYLIRTYQLDTIDMTNFNNIKINLDAHTDGDLSSIFIYRIQGDTVSSIFTLNGILDINNIKNITISSPKVNDIFYVRLKLFASVCTGQLYHLKLRDLKIYGE
jgi:hypothetical protein